MKEQQRNEMRVCEREREIMLLLRIEAFSLFRARQSDQVVENAWHGGNVSEAFDRPKRLR